MSLPILPGAVAPPAPELAIASRLQRQNAALLSQLVADFRSVTARLWRDPNTLAQAIFDEFGAEGEALLASIQARQDCIEAIAIANGQVLTDYLTTDETTLPAYTTSGGAVTVT